MLDLGLIREDPERVKKGAAAKGESPDIGKILELDSESRRLVTELESLRAERNKGSKEIGRLRREGEDTSGPESRMRALGDEIKLLEERRSELKKELDGLLSWVPNLPAEGVPEGTDESANVVARSWGEKPTFNSAPKPHWEVGEALGLIDFERAGRLAGAGFSLFTGQGARLVRSLVGFMLDLHTTEHGYEEISPPLLATRDCMFGTGQLPKLENDMYRLPEDDLFLIPTAEIPLTNLHRGEIIPGDLLPLCYASYTACFRREAGAHGRSTRGLVRVHQFDKVELVRVTRPEDSHDELGKLLGHAEEVLRRLGLHYRVVLLCTGELSFAASKCYDLELWAPGLERYLEVSSCSNFEDFQARRASIRFRDPETKHVRFAHTLNGSGVALPRLVAALLETCQTPDGGIEIPGPLRPYMGGAARLLPGGGTE